MKKVTKAQITSHVKKMLETNDGWATAALLKIYANQTSDEQASGITKYYNSIGFSGCDAEFLSSLAEQVKSWKAQKVQGRNKYHSPLSKNQMIYLHKKIKKYHRQIIAISDMAKLTAQVEVINSTEVRA